MFILSYLLRLFLVTGTAVHSQAGGSSGLSVLPRRQSLTTVPLFNPLISSTGPPVLMPSSRVPPLTEIEALISLPASHPSSRYTPAKKSAEPAPALCSPPVPAQAVEYIHSGTL